MPSQKKYSDKKESEVAATSNGCGKKRPAVGDDPK